MNNELYEIAYQLKEKMDNMFKPNFIIISDASFRQKKNSDPTSAIAFCIIDLDKNAYNIFSNKIKAENSGDAELKAVDNALRELAKITNVNNARILFISDNEPTVNFMNGDSKFSPFKKSSKVSSEMHNNRIILRALLFRLKYRAIHVRAHQYNNPEKKKTEVKRLMKTYGFSKQDSETILRFHHKVDNIARDLTK